ncbi:MAG: hypothetical protein ACTSV2_04045 [Candidatus Thorarchaeota archaeon]
MKIIYKNWEPDQGLEEAQEKIYTTVCGLPAQAEEIRERNIRRGTEATMYALTEEGAPLAYVTSYKDNSEPNKAYIGYPWSMPECPQEAQDKIFNDLLAHLKAKEGIEEIRIGVGLTSKIKDAQIEYLEKNDFVEVERAYQYNADLDVKETAELKLSEKAASLKSRVATEKDVEALVEVCLADEFLKNAFPSEEAFTAYFKDRVLKDGHAVLVFEGDKVIGASAPLRFKPDGAFLRGDEERILMRFTAVRTGYAFAWRRLLVEIAKECKSAGWTDLLMRIGYGFTARGTTAIGLAEIRPELQEYQIAYALKKE